jgi:hypothetical protein
MLAVTPSGITDTQSYSWVIRNVFFDALATMPFFADYTKRKQPMLPVQVQLLPYLGVYIIDEIMGPDGTANSGNIRFTHTVRIGFSVIVSHNDPDVGETAIDAAFWAIMNRLWTDEYITNVLDTYNPATQTQSPDNTRFESINRGVRRHKFGLAGASTETPIAELQYDASVFYRTTWSPIIPDDLNEIDVSTGVKPGDTQDEMDQRYQEKAKYIFNNPTKAAAEAKKQQRR